MILGGVFSILPVLGIWMLPVGVLLIAYDVRLLRRPVGSLTLWSMRKWADFRRAVPLKALLLGSALLCLMPFLVTLFWWWDAGFERSGSHWTAPYRIFLMIGLPSGITCLLILWQWVRSNPPDKTGPR
jgi:hypothetical protein